MIEKIATKTQRQKGSQRKKEEKEEKRYI